MSQAPVFNIDDYAPLIQSVERFLEGWLELTPQYLRVEQHFNEWDFWKAKLRYLLVRITDFAAYIQSGPDNIQNYLVLLDSALDKRDNGAILGLRSLHESGMRQIQQVLSQVKLYRDLCVPLHLAASKLSGWGEAGKEASSKKTGGKVFLSHGHNTQPLSLVLEFLSTLGLQGVVVEREASEGRSINETVREMLRNCDCAIIIATAEQQADGKWQIRQNVVNEVGLAQEALKDRVIYLVEDKVDDIPSNFREKVYERFSTSSMDKALIKIAKELKAFGLL